MLRDALSGSIKPRGKGNYVVIFHGGLYYNHDKSRPIFLALFL
jgi:hypothetical protein